MKLELYQVDAFTDVPFGGNSAAVCPLLGEWLEDSMLQKIAMENNLSETAFYIIQDGQYHLRWFTPMTEVDLCGHATLATAYVLFQIQDYPANEIRFNTKSGVLNVRREGEYLCMNFPSDNIQRVELTNELQSCFATIPIEVHKGISDYMFVYEEEKSIREITYDLNSISQVKARGVIITARGNQYDFVSRFFAPQSGVNEDPVTGSAHTTLTPYWSQLLNKKELTAYQLSARGGKLICRNKQDRVEILGQACMYLRGIIEI